MQLQYGRERCEHKTTFQSLPTTWLSLSLPCPALPCGLLLLLLVACLHSLSLSRILERRSTRPHQNSLPCFNFFLGTYHLLASGARSVKSVIVSFPYIHTPPVTTYILLSRDTSSARHSTTVISYSSASNHSTMSVNTADVVDDARGTFLLLLAHLRQPQRSSSSAALGLTSSLTPQSLATTL